MLTHLLRMTAATGAVRLCTLLPFLPGRYDSLAVPLSLMAQILGTAGLLLVPVGALWVASGYWRRLAGKQYGIAIAALIASSGRLGPRLACRARVARSAAWPWGDRPLDLRGVESLAGAEGFEERDAAAWERRRRFLSAPRAGGCGAPAAGVGGSGDRVQPEPGDPKQRATHR